MSLLVKLEQGGTRWGCWAAMARLTAQPVAVGSSPGAAGGTRRRMPTGSSVARAYWVDISLVAFIGLNLLAMRLLPGWGAIPFLTIWVSLTAIYGFRLWRLESTVLVVVVVTLATGGLIGWQVVRGKQDGDYLAEVP